MNPAFKDKVDIYIGKRPITLEVKKVDGEWLISSVVLGNYETGDSIKYRNRDYGFTFTLPKSWSGYTIVAETWEGRSVEGSTSGQITETGPKLLIRHPKWTKENPRGTYLSWFSTWHSGTRCSRER